ncbi:MAG: glycine cleavage system protein T [Planctomycetaceae bacterium]|nr:glycine cleavage system protein T [Planctomycetaceae bacterium]MDP7274161.1 glycine cleavage system aminomethyltransferase GcvT [Planctomycetaceae bacterium]
MSEPLLRTPCHGWHVANGARLVDFSGWEMPVQYTSITEEHRAVRTAAGLFDISHMGRIVFRGRDACRLLDRLVTNDVASIEVGRVRYALVCNTAGGILDDVLVYRFDGEYLLVVNASNREKIVAWIQEHSEGYDVEIEDRTGDWAMLAVQGPRSLELASGATDVDVAPMRYYRCAPVGILGHAGWISRTGYTGEDGFELIVPAAATSELWEHLLRTGGALGLVAAGLGCRDTLRLEAAMPLYGHELSEQIDPYTAGLGFAVKPEAAEFIGREAVLAAASRELPQRVGLKLEGRRIARGGATVFSGETAVGEVTSGTFSPTLEIVIAMAYVTSASAATGTAVEVDVRGQRVAAEVVELPFYRRPLQ